MELTFYKTANPYFNAGLIGFLRESERFLSRYQNDYTDIVIVASLEENKVTVNYSEEQSLMRFLEELYYFMGKTYYDTYTAKQDQKKENIYFQEKDGTLIPHRFPKIKTLGLTTLFTNDAQGVTRQEINSKKIDTLEKTNPEQAEFIKSSFKSANVKLLKKIYFNEPYTKITRLSFSPKYIELGQKICPITGEKFKVLVEPQNISPFFSGITNFNTHLNLAPQKISWKALYIIRFSPVVCFYSYHNKYETLICHLFESNNLENLNLFYRPSMYLKREELESNGYLHNIRLGKFSYPTKEGVTERDYIKDAAWASEISILLIYEFYQQHLQDKITIQTNTFDIFENLPIIKKPICLVTFKSDKFAKTIRPNSYEEYNHVRFVIQLIYGLEHGTWGSQILWQDIWQGLKWDSPKVQLIKKKNFTKGAAIERKIRSEVMEQILNGQTILPIFERLYYEVFSVLVSGEKAGYRKYQILLNFLKIYENLTNMELDKDIQERAINLGTSIGQGIIRSSESNDSRTAAKQGRKYIIDLRNARTQEQFLKAIERIMFRYQVNISKDLLSNVTQKNYLLIKHFTVISALNQLNSLLSSKSN